MGTTNDPEADALIARALAEGWVELNLSGCEEVKDLEPLRGLSALQSLDLSLCREVKDLEPLRGLSALQSLNLSGCWEVKDLEPLRGLFALQSLDLWECREVTDLEPLRGLSALQSLNLSRCEQVKDLEPLRGLSALQSLNLSLCWEVKDLEPLRGLSALQSLNLSGCREVKDLEPLRGLSALQSLDLSGCGEVKDLEPLRGLSALQSLNLIGCGEVKDLEPLRGLSALQSLNLIGCEQVKDLEPLRGLSALQSLDLTLCREVKDLEPLRGLAALQSLDLSGCSQIDDTSAVMALGSLKKLRLYGTALATLPIWLTENPVLEEVTVSSLRDVPIEVQSTHGNDNCLPRLRAWWRDQKAEAVCEPEVKLFLLGNGGVGKTQLARVLQGFNFDESILTTHGIQLASLAPGAAPLKAAARVNLWDFGGQDIYHGTHALFLKSQAVFLILWTPEAEEGGRYREGELELRHRPLAYWVDYVRQLAGPESPVLVVQSQCEKREQERRPPEELLSRLKVASPLWFSARTGRGKGALLEAVGEAIAELQARLPAPHIGRGWAAVRDEIRRRLAEEGLRTIERSEFEELCARQTTAGGLPQ